MLGSVWIDFSNITFKKTETKSVEFMISKSKPTKWLPHQDSNDSNFSPDVHGLKTELSVPHLQTSCLNGHLEEMSHTFPQQIKTAAVVVVRIAMTDLAYDGTPLPV